MTSKHVGLVLFCWAWLLSGADVVAQKVKDMERRYKAGVRLVQLGDYDRARSELQPVMQRGGSFAPFAYYYHADASYRQKRYEAARSTLKELIDRFPNWLKKEEGYYLAAAAAFEQGLYDEGLSYTQLITDPDLRPDIDRMEQTFLPRVSDLNRLKGLQKQYPQNKTLARTLVDLIQRTSSDKDDLELSDRLSNRYGITPTPVSKPPVVPPVETNVPANRPVAPPRTDRTKAKGYVNVGVLFPFRINRFSTTERVRTNQYVFDLYEGMKLAKAKLMAEGITVNLFAYDIDNDPDQALEVLNNSSFAQNDLLIGPLYTEPNRLVSAFALQNDIPLVNPIATTYELIATSRMRTWLSRQPGSRLLQRRALQRPDDKPKGRRLLWRVPKRFVVRFRLPVIAKGAGVPDRRFQTAKRKSHSDGYRHETDRRDKARSCLPGQQ